MACSVVFDMTKYHAIVRTEGDAVCGGDFRRDFPETRGQRLIARRFGAYTKRIARYDPEFALGIVGDIGNKRSARWQRADVFHAATIPCGPDDVAQRRNPVIGGGRVPVSPAQKNPREAGFPMCCVGSRVPDLRWRCIRAACFPAGHGKLHNRKSSYQEYAGMETVVLSTKGQLVIPASVRGVLRLKAGNRLGVTVEGGNIVLKPRIGQAWKPLNPAGARLSSVELSRPVELKHETRRR